MIAIYDESVEIYHKPNWPYIPNHPYRILIIGGSGSCKTNLLLNLTIHQRQILTKFIYRQRSIRIKVLIDYQQERKSRA